MLRSERDYIMRMIALAAVAVARLRAKLAGGTPAAEIVEEAGQNAEADRLDAAVDALRR